MAESPLSGVVSGPTKRTTLWSNDHSRQSEDPTGHLPAHKHGRARRGPAGGPPASGTSRSEKGNLRALASSRRIGMKSRPPIWLHRGACELGAGAGWLGPAPCAGAPRGCAGA